ncbi:MAG TPA: GAF domain-containing protein [Coleofasciculaceae cyanobacterium]
MSVAEVFKSKVFYRRDLLGLLLLVVAGFLGNYFRWTLFFDIDFLFGSIAVWLVVCLYGVRWGTLAACIAGSCTYIIWHHPYTTLTFTLEALFVGWLFHRRQQQNIVLLDAAFWLLIGMPLVWLFYAIVLQAGSTQALMILLKQPVNGIFNALIASLLLTYLPIHRWVARPPAMSTLSLQQTLFNLLVAFVMVPTLILIVLSSQQVMDDIKTTARADLDDAARYLTIEVHTWYERRLTVIKELAALSMNPSIQDDTLRQKGEFAQRVFPEFKHIHLLDQTGKRLLDIEEGMIQSQDTFDDTPYVARLQRSPDALLVLARPQPGSAAPSTAMLGMPIVQDGKFVGAVLSELDLSGITDLLKTNVGDRGLSLTLVDQQNTVVTSTHAEWVGQQPFDWRKQGKAEAIGEHTYHWLPTTISPLVMVQWNNSLFVKEVTISPEIPWRLIVQMAATPHVQHIETVHIRNLAILLVMSGCFAPLAALVVSRQLVQPVSQLAAVTTNLPDKLMAREPISWVQSQITEFTLLVQNFRSMAASLQQKFDEIQQANATLEHRVQERTQALQQSNTALRESEERFRQMAESIHEVFWMGSVAKDSINYVSPAYEEIWGCSCASLYEAPQSFLDAIHPEDRARVIVALAQQIQGGYNEEYRIIQPNGSIRWIWDRAFPIRNAAGEVYRLVGVAQDITERKQAEAIVRQQAERERLLGTITLQMRQSLELDDILQTTVTEIRQFLHTDRVLIYRFEPDWSGFIIAESVAAGWNSVLGRQITDPDFVQTRRQIYEKGTTKAIDDIYSANLDPCHMAVLEQMQVRAKLVVPILQDDQLWGLLVAQHCQAPRHWETLEIELQQQLATQLAIAIQQADLYRQSKLELAERQRAETALKHLNQELEQRVQERTQALQQQAEQERLLRLIIQNIHRSLDLDEVLATVLSETRQTLQCDRVAIYKFNPDWSGSFVAESVGAGWVPLVGSSIRRVWEDTHLQKTQGGRYRHNETFAVNDIYTIGHQQCHLDLLEQFQARAYAIVPIFVDDQLWGLLAAYQNGGARAWQDWEMGLLQQIGIQMAIALRQSQLYQAAHAQVQELERLHQLKDDFLSTVSHELRSPMANIKMATQMLEISLQPLGVLNNESNAINRYVKILREEGQREVNLINDLLDLARLDAGTDPLSFTTIELQYYIPHVTETFIERIHQQQQQLILDIPADLPSLSTDLPFLERILTELLHNACKYTPAGKTITISARSVSAVLEIRMSNSGIEIPAVECDRIFDKFYRIPNNDPWKHGGTGLGLALVKKLTERLGGQIHAESGDGQTTFVLKF